MDSPGYQDEPCSAGTDRDDDQPAKAGQGDKDGRDHGDINGHQATTTRQASYADNSVPVSYRSRQQDSHAGS